MPWAYAAAHAGFSSAQPWLPVDPAHADCAVDRQEADPESMLQQTRRLLALRRATPALQSGASRVLWAEGEVLLLQRGDGPDAILALFNLGAGEAPLPPMLAPKALNQNPPLWANHPDLTQASCLPGGAALFLRAT